MKDGKEEKNTPNCNNVVIRKWKKEFKKAEKFTFLDFSNSQTTYALLYNTSN